MKPVAISDAGVWLFELEKASSTFSEHGSGLGVQFDGFGEQIDGFVPEIEKKKTFKFAEKK